MPSELQFCILFLFLLRFIIYEWLRRKNDAHVLQLSFKLPKEIVGIMTEREWGDCVEYNLAKSRFSRREEITQFFIVIGMLLFLVPWFFSQFSEGATTSPWMATMLVSLFLIMLQLPDLLFDWFRQFELEEKFGFNQSSKKLWIADKIKGFFLGGIFLFLTLSCLEWTYFYLESGFPNTWWVFAFAIFWGIQLTMMILWPKFVIPLFNKLTPLEDGELKERLWNLADRTKFKAQAIEVIDGSKRSNHSNAYFTGFGKFRRIVLFDTLIQQMNIDQVEAVLAHEIGHYRLGHIPKRLFVSCLLGLAGFGLLSHLSESIWFYQSLNIPLEHMGKLSPLILLFVLFLGAFTFFLVPVSNYFSRKHEYDADRFASISLGGGESLCSALRQLYRENKSFPCPHPWFSFFHHSHPSLIERQRSVNAIDYSKTGG